MARKFKIMLICGLLVLVIVTLIADFVVYKPSTKKAETKNVNVATINLETLVNNLEAKIRSDFISLKPTSLDTANTLGYQLSDQSFQVILPTTYSFSLADTSVSNNNNLNSSLSQAKNYLASQKFSLSPYNGSSALASESVFYTNRNDLCQLTTSETLDVTCASLTNLKTIANQAAPLVSLYVSGSGNSNNSVNTPDFTTSRAPGYSLATLNIYNGGGETRVNYYKYGSSSWQMVNLDWYNDPHEDADITPNCGDFESVANTRAAYQGLACYDSSLKIMSTIK
jgi:hypothetical protein